MRPFKRAVAGGIATLALAAALAGGEARAEPDKPIVVAVQLNEFRFSPSSLSFEQGRSYILRLSNTGGVGHNFQAKTFFQAVELGAGARDRVRDGDVEVAKGQSVDVALTPTRAGVYPLRCTHPLHSMFGMTGRIIVR
jgi:uncharacterized cupredoxin-like copper-binding protein